MSCDIHCYVEHKKLGDDGYWLPFGGRINPGRNYEVFGRLVAGVRCDGPAVAPTRGFPDNAAWVSRHDNWHYVSADGDTSDGAVTVADANRWVAGGSSRRVGHNDAYVTDPDWHSHSWVTPDEWEAAITGNRYPCDVEYRALLAAMRVLEGEGRSVRVVLWFDN